MKFHCTISKVKYGLLFSVLTTLHILSASQYAFSYPFATFVMDAYSGQELHSQNANRRLHPASLTKMMTLYLVFNEVENGNLDLDEKVSVSRNAVREPPSKFGYRVGQKVSVRYLIRAAAIRSANDAATALGEAVSGTEAEFGKYMTRTARAMGMNQTSFRNANGLTASGHLSSAKDMAILSRRLLFDFPEYFHLFGRSSVVSLERKLYNTNRKFLASYRGSDGIKTGFTSAAGYNLAASAKRDNKRVIAVIFGSGSVSLRTKRMTELLDIGFARAKSFDGKKTLTFLDMRAIKNYQKFASGAVLRSLPPLKRPKGLLGGTISDIKKINDFIEDILKSAEVEKVSNNAQFLPLKRPNFFDTQDDGKASRSDEDKGQNNMEIKLLNILESSDKQHSFGILVGAYFTDFNAKKDLARLALSDLETLGRSDRSITTGVVDQKRVFRVNFTGLKKSDALKACQKLIARNELCEITDLRK